MGLLKAVSDNINIIDPVSPRGREFKFTTNKERRSLMSKKKTMVAPKESVAIYRAIKTILFKMD